MSYLHAFTDQHCSNCGRTVDFQLLYAHSFAVHEGFGERKQWREHGTDFRGLFACNYCRSPVTLDFRLRALTPIEQQETNQKCIPRGQALLFLNRLHPEILHRAGSTQRYSAKMTFESHEWGTKLNQYFTIFAWYPDSVVQAPTGIPKELEAEFVEIREVAASPRYTVVACRRLLERACKLVLGDQAPSKANLMKLIDQTLNRGETLSAIADWAHAIRAIGNDAAHDDAPAPTPDEAKETLAFTSLLVELLFSYPERVSSLRKVKQ
jgi:hypothetical protein